MIGNRRGLLVFVLLGAGMLTLPRFLAGRSGEIDAHENARGFRILRTDALTVQMDPLIGIPAEDEELPAPVARETLAQVLFRDGTSRLTPQVAYFTDVNCPQCRIMDRWLYNVPATRAQITIHDLPLLGPTSVLAARAIAAAKAVGQSDGLRRRFNRTRLVAEPNAIRAIGESIGLDPDTLIAGMQSERVNESIGESLWAAAELAIPGTPSLVIGDLLVIGRIEEVTFDRLLEAYHPAPELGSAFA